MKITIKKQPEQRTYKLGDLFQIGYLDHVKPTFYMLAQADNHSVVLINIENGCRFYAPITVASVKVITDKDMCNLTNNAIYTLVEAELIIA